MRLSTVRIMMKVTCAQNAEAPQPSQQFYLMGSVLFYRDSVNKLMTKIMFAPNVDGDMIYGQIQSTHKNV